MEADKQVQDPLLERLDMSQYTCNSIKIGFDAQEKIVHMHKL